MEGLINLIVFFVLILSAFFIGTSIEKAHYHDIKNREAAMVTMPVVTSENLTPDDDIQGVQMVYGSVVISLDYFKRFLAGLRNIFGGRVGAYETLLDRGRREAILRMKEQAFDAGYNMILNMRFETSSIGQVTSQKGSLGCFEVIAYGTAIKAKIRM